MAMDQMMPKGAPAPEGAAPQAGGDQFTELVSNISSMLGMLSEASAEINPAAGQKLSDLGDQFQSVISELMGSAPGGAPAGAGQASAQVGAAKAVPAGPQGVARG